jgi:hypothetical protein
MIDTDHLFPLGRGQGPTVAVLGIRRHGKQETTFGQLCSIAAGHKPSLYRRAPFAALDLMRLLSPCRAEPWDLPSEPREPKRLGPAYGASLVGG